MFYNGQSREILRKIGAVGELRRTVPVGDSKIPISFFSMTSYRLDINVTWMS